MAGYVLSAAAVAKLRRALAPKAGSSSRPGAGASPVAFDTFAAPFAVRWSATEAGGAWVMWLPDKTRCVSVAGEYVTPTGITAADDLPAGWYTIDNADAQATAVYLVLTTNDSTGATTAAIDTAAGTASTGETVTNIIIASLASDSETGAKRVRPFVVGALALGAGGAVEELTPDDVSTEAHQATGASTERLQIKDWDSGANTGTTARTHTLGEILAGAEDLDASTINEKMMVRPTPAEGQIPELAYRTVGALPFDGKSVEGFNDGSSRKIQVKGFSAAAEGQVPVKRGNAIVWEPQSGGGADISALNGVTLVTNVEWIGSPTYVIRVSKRTATVANNTLTLGPVATTDIATTPITEALS